MAKDIGGVWRTVGGRRIFIKDGQDLASAMKESGKFNSSSNSKAKKGDSVLEEFKKSDGNTKSFEQALNKISEMEYNNEINPDEYKEYISKIQKEYADKKKSEKTNIKSDDKNLLSQIEQETDSYAYKELLDEYNAGKLTSADLEDTLKTLKKFNSDTDDLMTANQLKGKDREEQKEINKQYLKEQNKLAKEKELVSDYNKTDSRGSMSDDSFIEQARKNGMSDEQIAKEVYKKHNGPESNNTSDNNIKRLLAKQTKEEAIAKGDKKRAETFENYEKKFEERVNIDTNLAKEMYEGTKKTENMAKENLERAKRNGASVEDLSNRTKQVHELELETQKAQEHANKMSARANSNNLENKYKISKTNDGKEYMRTISPYDETEYAYAEKRNDSWYVKDPTKKTGSGSSQTHIYNDVNEARAKMEEINNRIKGNSENSGKNYEGVTYNNYKKEEVNEASVDHRNESKTSSDVMNTNIRNAYQEYKKKHPGSKINFSKFKDNYKS